MAGDQQRIDRRTRERTAGAPPPSRPDGDLDMGGGGPTGASGPGTPHRGSGGGPLAGALDDLPDMTGSNPPGGDDATMDPGGGGFDASDAYTGVESDDAVLNSRPSGNSKERDAHGGGGDDLGA